MTRNVFLKYLNKHLKQLRIVILQVITLYIGELFKQSFISTCGDIVYIWPSRAIKPIPNSESQTKMQERNPVVEAGQLDQLKQTSHEFLPWGLVRCNSPLEKVLTPLQLVSFRVVPFGR